MASTREERLQMRQRGAGTREIKKVDFGFAFGGPSLGPSEPAALINVPEPAVPPQPQPVTTSTPQASQASSQTELQEKSGSQRTPGSARNKLPQRPSTYDIPSDDTREEPRSNKRRRINPPQSKSPSLSQPPTSQNNEAISIPNGKSSQPDEPANRASEKTVANASQTEITDKSPRNRPSLAASSVHEQNATEVNTGTEAAGKNNSAGTQEQPRALRSGPEATEEPKSQSTKPARGRPPKVSRQEQPGEDVQREGKRKKQQTDAPQQAKDNGNKTAKHNRPRSNRTSISPSGQRPTEPTATNARRRHDSSGVPETDREQHNDTIQAIQAQTAEDVAEEVENETQNKSSIAQQNTASKPKRGRGRPSLASKAAEARNEQQKAPTGPEHTAGEPSAAAARRGRKKKAEPPREAENVSPELEEEQEPEPEAEAPSHKTRRGRPSKKPRRTVEREPSPATEQQDTEPVSPTRRKTREPRGETVPVTVHRLANVSALGAMYADADGSADEDEESADELSTRQKTKLPNRGGVNPADVLSQICRETLEKTLTTLKNGIANETNATRRAEWTRKRKAVEAFGSELDGRLLDLSEMLDSNFVLGVQLKKAKREMLDLRSHLYKVRQERDEIALQMDAVRAKHMEEESAKTTRATINNSLHSLELALERSQRGPSSTEPSTANLEFLLRTVADSVSSRAPGAHGGLLQQIRTFNAQLEDTARRFEGE